MFTFCLIYLLIFNVFGRQYCNQYTPNLLYFKIRNCYKSTLPVIGVKDTNTVKDCMEFARNRQAFAFNYSPIDAKKDVVLRSAFSTRNCQIIGCPEIRKNSSTLVPDPVFDYYSAYGNFNSTRNATCFRSIGIFTIYETKLNYTEAILNCQNLGGDLVDITTEQRNSAISHLLNSLTARYKSAYIGLDDLDNVGKFKTSMGDLLDCRKYRSWCPGHPRYHRHNGRCVILNVDKYWRTINCRIRLPSICELYPESPPINLTIDIPNVDCKNIHGKMKKNHCLKKKEFYDLYNSSSRIDQCALLNQDNFK